MESSHKNWNILRKMRFLEPNGFHMLCLYAIRGTQFSYFSAVLIYMILEKGKEIKRKISDAYITTTNNNNVLFKPLFESFKNIYQKHTKAVYNTSNT